MICDAHIHVGYFNRKGYDGPFYYSPRRVCSVLRKCGVDEFIFSSTSMQTHGIVFADVHKEAQEVVKIWGRKAHPFLWVSKAYLAHDPKLSCLDEGLYEGIKLHGRETPWLAGKMSSSLDVILECAARKGFPVMVHTGPDTESDPTKWLKWAIRYPTVRFNFAHCWSSDVTCRCLDSSENIYSDVSCAPIYELVQLAKMSVQNRVLWGTDFPALSARTDASLTGDLRQCCSVYEELMRHFGFELAFQSFLGGHQ